MSEEQMTQGIQLDIIILIPHMRKLRPKETE